jgi:hypothetical protein
MEMRDSTADSTMQDVVSTLSCQISPMEAAGVWVQDIWKRLAKPYMSDKQPDKRRHCRLDDYGMRFTSAACRYEIPELKDAEAKDTGNTIMPRMIAEEYSLSPFFTTA